MTDRNGDGEEFRECQASMLRAWPFVHSVGDVWAAAGATLGERRLTDYELVYFPDGSSTIYETDEETYKLDKPCFIFTRPGEGHRYRFDPNKNVRHLFVHFDYEELRRGDARFDSLLFGSPYLPVSGNSLLPALLGQMVRIADFQLAYWKRRLSALLSSALEELCASADNALEELARPLPLPISQALTYMEDHLEESITIEAVARQSGWSHEHFTRMFVASVGMSPKRALLERRLRRAELLMQSGRWTVKQIAYRVGFRDEHHFSKMYKRLRGMTASAYIARCESSLAQHALPAPDTVASLSSNRHVLVNEQIK